MQGIRLIVHADDFGLSRRVNEGILEAHRQGIVTSASLIACGEAFENAIHLSRTTPTLDLGVHLTLTAEHPVSKRDEIPTLLDKQGRFHAGVGAFVKHYFTQRVSLDEVRRELDAQISRVIAQGVTISHLDGHQHLHMLRGIRRIVGGLARKYEIRAIRFPRERFDGYMFRDVRNWHRLLGLTVLNAFCAVASADEAKHPDYFLGFFYGGRLTRANLAKLLQYLPSTGTCELMCHPGLHDAEGLHAHWGYRWQDELDALTDKGIQRYLSAKGIKLISYASLVEP